MNIQHWIFDAYNVMHALNYIDANTTQDFELARERFISWMQNFQNQGTHKVTLVFDSNTPQDCQEYHKINVIFSPRGFNADGTILLLVRNTHVSQRPNITVVTRDFMLRDALFAYKCIVISPESFAREFAHCQSHHDKSQSRYLKSQGRFYQPFKNI